MLQKSSTHTYTCVVYDVCLSASVRAPILLTALLLLFLLLLPPPPPPTILLRLVQMLAAHIHRGHSVAYTPWKGRGDGVGGLNLRRLGSVGRHTAFLTLQVLCMYVCMYAYRNKRRHVTVLFCLWLRKQIKPPIFAIIFCILTACCPQGGGSSSQADKHVTDSIYEVLTTTCCEGGDHT